MTTADEEMENNILATGAVWAMLALDRKPGLIHCEPEFIDGYATNQIIIRLDFLKSAYRLTIERIPDSEEDNT